MAWAALLVAGLLEVVWSYFMKRSEGFTRPGPSAITIIAMIASFALLSYAMKSLPLGTAYTIWTGIGAIGAFGIGVLVLHEPASALRILAACLVIGGLVLFRVAEGRA
jgi:quaternary ammonium compound-resistance protein SugE